jgi:hypothetical protein
MKHDIKKLPKWAQSHIADLKHEITVSQGLKKAHGLLCDKERDWFTVPNNTTVELLMAW